MSELGYGYGDIVSVALDCVRDEKRGGYRILVRGVFDEQSAAKIPLPLPGAHRNVVDWFLNVPSSGEPGAFFIGDASA